MNELALFAGAAGGMLAGHILGWRTVCAVERDAHAAEVLAQRQNDGIFAPFPVWSDVRTFNGYPWQGRIDVISGGFPCQNISAAGDGAGITGKRSGLWKQMARIIHEVRPRFVFVENSPLLTRRGLDVVLGDLAALGYDAEWCVLGAADAGAPHQRDRIWILGHSCGLRRPAGRQHHAGHDRAKPAANGQHAIAISHANGYEHEGHPLARDGQGQGAGAEDVFSYAHGQLLNRSGDEWSGRGDEFADCREYAAHPPREGLEERQGQDPRTTREADVKSDPRRVPRRPAQPGLGRMADGLAYRLDKSWPVEPGGIPRVANGVPHRVGRLKCIGNGQVPACAVIAWLELVRRFFA